MSRIEGGDLGVAFEAHRASYLELAAFIQLRGGAPIDDRLELFRRMVFNILVGNNDDHARNHAFFWDGDEYALTPAYDICPCLRSGRTTSQAMTIGREGRRATLVNAVSECALFGLDPKEARRSVDALLDAMRKHWVAVADEAGLTGAQRSMLERETVLGPGALEGWE